MTVSDLARASAQWFAGTGAKPDLVVSTRIRLARNLAERPFVARASDPDLVQIAECVAEQCRASRLA